MRATDHRRNDDRRRTTILVASLSVAFAEVARVDFQASIENLLVAAPAPDNQFALSGAGVPMEGGLVMHTSDESPAP